MCRLPVRSMLNYRVGCLFAHHWCLAGMKNARKSIGDDVILTITLPLKENCAIFNKLKSIWTVEIDLRIRFLCLPPVEPANGWRKTTGQVSDSTVALSGFLPSFMSISTMRTTESNNGWLPSKLEWIVRVSQSPLHHRFREYFAALPLSSFLNSKWTCANCRVPNMMHKSSSGCEKLYINSDYNMWLQWSYRSICHLRNDLIQFL